MAGIPIGQTIPEMETMASQQTTGQTTANFGTYYFVSPCKLEGIKNIVQIFAALATIIFVAYRLTRKN